MYNLEKFNNIPVTICVTVILIIIFTLYKIGILTKIPCETNIYEVFAGIFTHIELEHLILNISALYVLSRLEHLMGSKSFIWLLAFLISFNTLVEYIFRIIFKLKCSIGFSGILFGIITWEIFYEKHVNLEIILSIFLMVIIPSMHNKHLSIEGHFLGAVSGVIGALLWKKYIY